MKFEDVIRNNNPAQNHEELSRLLSLITHEASTVMPVNNVLEIGVHRGGTYGVWGDVFKPNKLIGIDHHVELAAVPAQQKHEGYLLEGESQSPLIKGQVEGILKNEKLDFLFIDGGHSYDEVRTDFEMYAPLVREGGAIALHDIAVTNNEPVGVRAFWIELKQRYTHWKEFIYEPIKKSDITGIGVIIL